ncbi:uncharacterized protein [Rhodnius prolixus]|uniref:uncharacterized protein n=1 Tax=Rhodnius prolixus TaxID=13249 RepID=UPI003D18E032
MEVLDLEEKCQFDNSIECIELHSHHPYASSKLLPGDEIRISVQHQDLYTLPSQSLLYLEGKFLKEDGSAVPVSSKLTNNAFAFLFDEIRYELSGVEIDRVKNPGIACTLKGLASLKAGCQYITNWGWCYPQSDALNITSAEGCFNLCIPLSSLLGFCEDYQKIVINVKQELILVRSRQDGNAYKFNRLNEEQAVERCKIEMVKLCWMLPYVTVNEHQRLALMRHLKSAKVFALSFRSWELYDYPLLPATQRQIWSVKTSSQMEKPRYIILAFQTGRANNVESNASHFDHCSISNVKLYLNCKAFPYGDLNVDFSSNRFAILYHMYASFQMSYYGEQMYPLSSLQNFKEKTPLIVIDCSKQCESIKCGPVDVRLEFESKEMFPPNTTAYCLIIHDRVVEYNPLTGIVRRMV